MCTNIKSKLYFRNIISKPKLNSYEVFELFEGDPLLILDPLLQPLLAIEEGEAEQDEGEVKLTDGRAPLETSANLIWMTSVWRLFMKVQNCLNSSSPAPSRPNRCSRMLVSTPGASSGHCPHPPAFASTNNYFALQFRAEVIHHLGDCSKDGLQAVCPRAKSPEQPEGGVLVSASLPPV